jgi:hypothetical protein
LFISQVIIFLGLLTSSENCIRPDIKITIVEKITLNIVT